jgi:hypothetical protein
VMEEYAAATEELIENLTKKHAKQIEVLIKSNTKAMAKLMATIKSTPTPSPAASSGTADKNAARQAAKHKSWVKKCKMATTFLHCNKVHPNRTHDQCWELEANSAKCMANWKSSKTV